MLRIAREDAPWVWGYHPKDYGLSHSWVSNVKPNQIARNGLKYLRIDAALRERRREEWNQPILWPIGLGLGVLIALMIPAIVSYRRRERMVGKASA